MTLVVINPGTGNVPGALLRNAWRSIRAFRRDLGVAGVQIKRLPKRDCDGRYAFALRLGSRVTEVEMPGLEPSRVRFTEGENAWDFPRLYVDGSSWLWPFALNNARDELGLPRPEKA